MRHRPLGGGGRADPLRVALAVLLAAQAATSGSEFVPFEAPIGLDVVIWAPVGMDPWEREAAWSELLDVLAPSRRGCQSRFATWRHRGDPALLHRPTRR